MHSSRLNGVLELVAARYPLPLQSLGSIHEPLLVGYQGDEFNSFFVLLLTSTTLSNPEPAVPACSCSKCSWREKKKGQRERQIASLGNLCSYPPVLPGLPFPRSNKDFLARSFPSRSLAIDKMQTGIILSRSHTVPLTPRKIFNMAQQ